MEDNESDDTGTISVGEEISYSPKGYILPEKQQYLNFVKNQRTVNVYVCSFCSHKVPKKSMLKKHYTFCKRKVLPVHTFICAACPQVYKQERYLLAHINKVHKSKLLCCKNCLFETPFKKEFKEHFVNDKCPEERVYSCSECSLHRTVFLHNLLNHMTTHSKNKVHPYSPQLCVHCNAGFRSCIKLQKHLLYHNTVIKRYCCEYCKFNTLDLEDLQKHKTDEHCKEKIDLVKCSRCNQKFFSMKWLKDHILREHKTLAKANSSNNTRSSKNLSGTSKVDPKMLKCKLCNYSTKSALRLNRHSYTIHRVNIYKCEKLESGTVRYHCCECTMKTCTFSRLRAHFKDHYTEGEGTDKSDKYDAIERLDFTRNPHYVCDVCNLVIMDQCQLAYHKLAKHGINNELFKCKLCCTSCDYNFLTKKICFEHGKDHVKEHNLSRVCFRQLYNAKEVGTFTIDYCSQIVTVENKIIQTGQKLDADVETITFSGKLEVLSFLQDEYIEDIKKASNLGDMLKWNIPEEVDLDPTKITRKLKKNRKRLLEDTTDMDSSSASANRSKENTQKKMKKVLSRTVNEEIKSDVEEEPEQEPTQDKIKDCEDLLAKQTDVIKSTKEFIECQLCRRVLPLLLPFLKPHTNQHAATLRNRVLEVFYGKYTENGFVPRCRIKAEPVPSRKGYCRLDVSYFKCNLCGMNVQQREDLQRHANRHAREKNSPGKVGFVKYLHGNPVEEVEMESDPFKYKDVEWDEMSEAKVLEEGYSSEEVYITPKTVSCTLCDFTCSDRDALREHYNEHKITQIVSLKGL